MITMYLLEIQNCRDFITYYLSENYIINRGSDKKFDLYLSDSFLSNGLIDFKS